MNQTVTIGKEEEEEESDLLGAESRFTTFPGRGDRFIRK